MKFTLSILALLAIAFLVGCSAKDTSNDIGKAELTELSKKYSGTYVFSRKFESEIKQRERERKDAIKKLKGRDLGGGLYAVDTKPVDEKFPQTLSNGKQYYLRSNYRGKVVIPEEVSLKIKNYIGEKAYKHCSIVIEEFYIDDNEQLQVISLSLMFYVGYTKFGLFGDEGRGFSLSRKDVKTLPGNNKIYIEDLEKR
ncbi:tRNA 2-selenouridine synthase [uncultured Campylobacter sp.]|uniref:tRNA 2-selenouridine synthase n=1 Tax=uncultured Campylobacter sp. TaxID=218934 RepID=UPI0028E81A44|nr:tRNA 2-selenouridine synthase [uncultured Campylobacter sp.]